MKKINIYANPAKLHDKKGWYESLFRKGMRVEVVSFCNEEPNYPAGSQGTIRFVDDACQIHVDWDNGGSIALIPEKGDVFKVILTK